MGISKVSANGLTLGPANTISYLEAQGGAGVNPEQLGFSIYDNEVFASSNGFITLNNGGPIAKAFDKANSANILAQAAFNQANNRAIAVAGINANTIANNELGLSIYDKTFFTAENGFITANTKSFVTIVSGEPAQVNVGPPTNANSAVRFSDLISLPADLLITAIGSLDIQMTASSSFASVVDSSGSPSYISNPSNITLLGNASSLGTNYTIGDSIYQNSAPGNGVQAVISLVIDLAVACNLESSKYEADGKTIKSRWKGNFNFSAFSALFKIYELLFWDYPYNNPNFNHQTFAYQCDMIPVTNDPESPSYGKYTVNLQVFAGQPYHNANIGARWMGTATKVRNLYASLQALA